MTYNATFIYVCPSGVINISDSFLDMLTVKHVYIYLNVAWTLSNICILEIGNTWLCWSLMPAVAFKPTPSSRNPSVVVLYRGLSEHVGPLRTVIRPTAALSVVKSSLSEAPSSLRAALSEPGGEGEVDWLAELS